jgi:tetratricopeptide (TPR) repeat protein
MRVTRAGSLIAAVVLHLLLPGTSHAGEAKNVFKKMTPSVVLIKDLEGHGSGVVISPDGLILTNFHVVNTPLPLTVSAMVNERGRLVSKTFKRVKLVGVHPRYDAALIKVHAPGVRFHPATSIPVGTKVETADNCYVIGNPSGAQGTTLRNTITPGLISAASRKLDGLSYIQTNAAINPGNSGGALSDGKGNLIGIVTFKVDQAEGLGFAIPSSQLQRSAFKKLSERRGNRKKGVALGKRGSKYFRAARKSSGKRKEALMFLAFISYRLALSEMPGDSGMYHNVGIMYYELKEPEVARHFFEKAIELGIDSPLTYHMLGIIAVNKKQLLKSSAYWRRGLECKISSQERTRGASSCADNLAISMINSKHYGPAVYFATWARRLYDNPGRRGQMSAIIANSRPHLDAALVTKITARRTGFSFVDMATTTGKTLKEVHLDDATTKKALAVTPSAGSGTAVTSGTQPKTGGLLSPGKPGPKPTPRPQPKRDPQEVKREKMARDCSNWFQMYRNFKRAGKKELARRYLQRIIDRYPKSTYAERARKNMGDL